MQPHIWTHLFVQSLLTNVEKLQAYEKLKQKEEANVKLLQKQLADALLRVQKISKIQQELKANCIRSARSCSAIALHIIPMAADA